MDNLELTVTPKMDTTQIEQSIANGKKVEEAVVEKSLNYDSLTQEEQKAIDDFLAKMDINNTNQVIAFGTGAQTKISKFSDSILQTEKTKDTGEVGGLLTDLVVQIKDFDSELPKDGKAQTGIFGIFNSAKKQIEKLIAKYDKVENNIGKIEKELEGHKLQMMKDIEVFDTMYEKNLEYFKELSLSIIAGEKKLEELKTVT